MSKVCGTKSNKARRARVVYERNQGYLKTKYYVVGLRPISKERLEEIKKENELLKKRYNF